MGNVNSRENEQYGGGGYGGNNYANSYRNNYT